MWLGVSLNIIIDVNFDFGGFLTGIWYPAKYGTEYEKPFIPAYLLCGIGTFLPVIGYFV